MKYNKAVYDKDYAESTLPCKCVDCGSTHRACDMMYYNMQFICKHCFGKPVVIKYKD